MQTVLSYRRPLAFSMNRHLHRRCRQILSASSLVVEARVPRLFLPPQNEQLLSGGAALICDSDQLLVTPLQAVVMCIRSCCVKCEGLGTREFEPKNQLNLHSTTNPEGSIRMQPSNLALLLRLSMTTKGLYNCYFRESFSKQHLDF